MRFSQVDVFSARPWLGNPVAVVHDADGLSDAEMAAFANWTNLSETTFLLTPTEAGRRAGADYRLRIFTPALELPFAGHPTLGSARAWLEAGGRPRSEGSLVQECGAGLVPVRTWGDRLAFAAPPLLRSGPATPDECERAIAALGVDRERVLDAAWVDNGPGWLGLLLDSAETVLGLTPDAAALRRERLDVGVIGPYPAGGPADFEVRAFIPEAGVAEDPVTGSLNAGLAQWLIGSGRAPSAYTARQGTALGRDGRVEIVTEHDQVWVGGAAVVRITGEVDLAAAD